ncbi:MAG: hypothetical protein D3925_08785 [Candidatus Electrothrix sp. AR5]|nr:hypothetical protein [Candidatus Electrothrix sp. AR5]
MEFLFKRYYARENYPAKEVGEQQDEQTLEAGTAAEITQRYDFSSQNQSKYPPYFALSQVIIFSGDILLFHNILFFYYPPQGAGWVFL